MQALELTGQRFGRLVAIRVAFKRANGNHWLCVCDCGKETTATAGNLHRGTKGKGGGTFSCGCFSSDVTAARNATHGLTANGEKPPLYDTWTSMIKRCSNPACKSWPDYGGRGIKVCERWQGDEGFANFLADMGPKPTPQHTIERKNNDGNYEPINCRWATRLEQASNTRKVRPGHLPAARACIRWLRRAGADPQVIAGAFGVSAGHVYRITREAA